MREVLLVIELILAIAIVIVVLLQRSEGGALGIGGGGGGFISGRSASNLLTKLTAILAAGFFVTCLALTILAGYSGEHRSILDQAPASTAPAPESAPNQSETPAKPSVPLSKQ